MPTPPEMETDAEMVNIACRFVRMHGKALARHLADVKESPGVRAVHQVRVACRRLRSGFGFFGDFLDPADRQRWRKRLRKTLKRFGPARDCDVQIRFLSRFLRELPDDAERFRPGIRALRRGLKRRRKALQPGLVRAASRLRRKGTVREMRQAASRLSRTPATPAACLHERPEDRIRRQVGLVRAESDTLRKATDIEGHHRLRMAVKRLRYTLEVCDLSEAAALRQTVQRLRDYQDRLGKLRDCDVWMEQIDAILSGNADSAVTEETVPPARIRSGLRHLRANRRRHRAELFRDIRKQAAALEGEGFWKTIDGTTLNMEHQAPNAEP